MTTAKLIASLGGARQVADTLGVGRSAVTMWCTRDAISADYVVRVWRLAVAAGLDWRPSGFEGLEITAAAPIEAAR